jgi:mRNA interferase RelE/StbE
MYEILFSSAAIRDHKKLPREVLKSINVAIETLKGSPRPIGCKKLTNRDAYRIRVADYRIIYEIHDKTVTVLVIRIRHRREVYLD